MDARHMTHDQSKAIADGYTVLWHEYAHEQET